MTQFKKIFCKNYFVPKKEKKYWKNYSPYKFCLLLTTLQNQFSPHIQYIPLPLSLPVQSQFNIDTPFCVLNYWMDLLQIFRNYFLGFLYLHDTPLSVCLYVCQSKNLTGHLLLNYWMDLLQIFRNYFLGSLYLHVLPLSVCLSVKILE